ncbi:MAG: Dipeptidyl aminopeptidase BI [Flavobacteriia bacterium]|nr:MAG: Dipeptidyl aminopeptidase BI [Flavobacteriia bacterium]
MNTYSYTCGIALSLFISACDSSEQNTPNNMEAPVAEKKIERLIAHGETRLDPYFWMNQRKDPEVIDHLNKENAYREQIMSGTTALQETLFDEIKGRIKEDDRSVPYRLDGYYYYSRYETGQEHPMYCRKEGNMEAEEEVMLDVNELAKEHSYYDVGGLKVRPDKKMIAFSEDTLSRRIYTIRFKDLETGEIMEERIPNTSGNFVWANDNQTGFYSVKDESLRSYKIFRHRLGTDASEDVEVYHEADETFSTFVYRSKSKKYIIIGSGSTLSDEYRILPADQPLQEFQIFQERERGLEYQIAHFEDKWFVRTNLEGATNFRLMSCQEGSTEKEHWTETIPHRHDVYLESFELFRDHLVLDERSNGLTRIRIIPWEGEEHYLDFGEEAYSAGIGNNPEFDSQTLRYGYSSLTTPSSVLDYDMVDREKTLLKEYEIVGGYDKSEYQTQRIWAEAEDGAKVPISLVYKKELFKKDGSNPLLVYGYGSYGITVDARFSSVRLSLLDRGFVYAIAHIRGGQYLGRNWYEDGKLMNKRNTFTDFISCTKHLQEEGFSRPKNTFAYGGSAGGLLMGAVVNMAPELYRGVIAAVPFVDVLTTMLDETIPLTTGEYDEWGNPNDSAAYAYMSTYSPYDNVREQHYPAMLVTTGLHDSQVQYWEPAKWVARLREMKRDNNPLLLYCNMETGHSGASGRFESLRETAMEYAFLLDLAGIGE